VRDLTGHRARVASLAWNGGGSGGGGGGGQWLSSGGRDSQILNHDLRQVPAEPFSLCGYLSLLSPSLSPSPL